MAGVVKSMDATLKSMNLEKVNRLTFLGAAHQKAERAMDTSFKKGNSNREKRFCSEVGRSWNLGRALTNVLELC